MSKSSALSKLTLRRGDLDAGVLSRTPTGCRFDFNDQFIKDSKYEGLSFQMKKNQGPFIIEGTNLHPFFAGLLPEGYRLGALISQLKVSKDDLFTLFAETGRNVIGDVSINSPRSADKDINLPKIIDIDLNDYLRKISKLNSYAQGEDAFSGVQEKLSASKITFHGKIQDSKFNYIIKLNPPDKQNLVANEYHCLRLAQLCGLQVSSASVVRDKVDNQALLVQRFDRVWNQDLGQFDMRHQEDACQFLDRYGADKYRLSIAEIAKGIEEFATAPKVTLLKLLQLYCFSYLIGNGDLHAKNISLIVGENGIVDLTPAYDLICTYIYKDLKMALRIDGKDDNIKQKTVVEFGKGFGIPEKSTLAMLQKLVTKFKRHADVLKDIPSEDRAAANIQRMLRKRTDDLSGS
jgi:serine/threonine-protein kinase HipA